MASLWDAITNRLGRKRNQPARETRAFPFLIRPGRVGQGDRIVFKPTPRNLRFFSLSPYPRRAINAIKNPIKMLDWDIAPIKGVDWNSELKRQAEVATICFTQPNETDDFSTLLEQVVEDFLIGAGAIETQVGGDKIRPLWMWPVDGLSVHINPQWNGRDPNDPRYAQSTGYGSAYGGGQLEWLRDDELLYLRPNPTTATPFGYGPLEIAFNTISRLLGVSEFAGKVAGNARPSTGLDLGAISPEDLQVVRSFWTNEVEGQGQMPIFGSLGDEDGKGGMKVLRFYPEGDKALYLQYQEFLQRELAAAFDISPQNFGIERDVNRNTSEVAEDRDWDQVIKPTARALAKSFTRHCVQRLLGFSQLQFRFVGIDREDEMSTAEILERRWRTNSITPNELRERFGEERMEGVWGDKTWADVQIALNAARSAGQVLDEDLPQPKAASSKAEPKPKRKPAA